MYTLNRNVEMAVSAINKQIDGLLTYGLRVQPIVTYGYRISWSNGMSKWWRYYQMIPAKKGEVTLDANELFISGHTKPTLEAALPLLKQHPLYSNSMEASMTLHVKKHHRKG